MGVYPHWDWASMILYIAMGVISAKSIKCVNQSCGSKKCTIKDKNAAAYYIWFALWIVLATWRCVAPGIGGIDASSYVQYFEVCLNPRDYWFAEHVDILYRYVNKGVRLFTSDYHVLFFILYGFIIFSYIVFIENFRFSRMNYIPLILIIYVFLRSYNTLRTSLGIACILISLVNLKNRKVGYSIAFALASALFQIASLVYAGFLVFYYMYRKKIKISTCVVWILIAALVGRFGQYIIANYDIPFLSHGSYRWYAVYSQEGQTFFSNFWKIAFSQMLLGVTMLVMWRQVKRDIDSRNQEEQERLNLLLLLCCYDIILIPVTYILNIWRGYEYLYVIRLLMWCELLPLIKQKFTRNSYNIIQILFYAVFIGWLVFRQYNTWEDSGLMPYVFEPLYAMMKSR